MLDFRDLGLEGIERLCQADLAWELVPLYYCPGKGGKACIVFVCSQLAIYQCPFAKFNTYSHQWQQDDCAIIKDSESGVHSSLFKGSPVKTAKHVCCGIFLLPILPLSSAPSPLAGLAYGLICRLLWDFLCF